jgi:hypothetical protein
MGTEIIILFFLLYDPNTRRSFSSDTRPNKKERKSNGDNCCDQDQYHDFIGIGPRRLHFPCHEHSPASSYLLTGRYVALVDDVRCM